MLSDILYFKQDGILMAHGVQKVKMLNRAKFRGNWLKHYRDITIFQISA